MQVDEKVGGHCVRASLGHHPWRTFVLLQIRRGSGREGCRPLKGFVLGETGTAPSPGVMNKKKKADTGGKGGSSSELGGMLKKI